MTGFELCEGHSNLMSKQPCRFHMGNSLMREICAQVDQINLYRTTNNLHKSRVIILAVSDRLGLAERIVETRLTLRWYYEMLNSSKFGFEHLGSFCTTSAMLRFVDGIDLKNSLITDSETADWMTLNLADVTSNVEYLTVAIGTRIESNMNRTIPNRNVLLDGVTSLFLKHRRRNTPGYLSPTNTVIICKIALYYISSGFRHRSQRELN